MQIRAKLMDDGALIIYREKWGVIFTQLAIGVFSVLFPIYFYDLTYGHAPMAFLIVFCGFFLFCGLALLIKLPSHARKILANDGEHVLVANKSGITLTPYTGSLPQHKPWQVVTEVILTEKLIELETDGEKNYSTNQLIVIFNPDAYEKAHWLDKLRTGTSVVKSGKGHSYLSSSYPKNNREMIYSSFKSLAPSNLRIRICRKVNFDCKSSKDSYIE